jgi:hypothetical protein
MIFVQMFRDIAQAPENAVITSYKCPFQCNIDHRYDVRSDTYHRELMVSLNMARTMRRDIEENRELSRWKRALTAVGIWTGTL